MVQRISRNGAGAEYDVAYAIGSGVHAIGFIVQLRDHLFQSPLCFYPGQGWGMAPGYENSTAPDFYRAVTPECLFCHSGQANLKPDTLNSYQDPPFEAQGITCERCHGPSETHLRNPVPGSIINPSHLASAARNSICEQCHLSGEIRIPNPNERMTDFRSGQTLEDVFSTYVFERSLSPAAVNPFKVISQVHQLALSTCARNSGDRLWCGTCHDPHELPKDPVAYFRSRCLSCHGTALLQKHPKPNQDCIGCHMPRRPVTDGGHTTFTDHRITRTRPPDVEFSPVGVSDTLVPWREPPARFADRNLGLAEINVGEKLKMPDLAVKGARLLISSWKSLPQDAAALTGIGEALFSLGRYDDSAAAYEQAIKVEPNIASNYLHAAVAWRAANNETKAIQYLQRTIELDPMIQEAYGELAGIYARRHESDLLRQTWKGLLEAFPKSIEAQLVMRELAHP
jgi:Tetratricopeptide repeat/Cytochrome c554 and c-prime